MLQDIIQPPSQTSLADVIRERWQPEPGMQQAMSPLGQDQLIQPSDESEHEIVEELLEPLSESEGSVSMIEASYSRFFA